MSSPAQIRNIVARGRSLTTAVSGDPDLGPLTQLPGVWGNTPNLPGRGWNMIALPFVSDPGKPSYRLLVNQYNETLRFDLVDKAVANRGITVSPTERENSDQFLVALAYEQVISQIAAADFPESGLAGAPGAGIHHEPGLWLHMLNHAESDVDIARLSTIPHGDSILALGKFSESKGAPQIPDISGLPDGVAHNLESPYLAPYRHFHEKLFEGLFDPTIPNERLKQANAGVKIKKTTTLTVDTKTPTGGISNIPFIIKQANAASMKSTFWIQELEETDEAGMPKLRLQYSQIVMLDFFPRGDGLPGLIGWPHVSINTLEKVSTSQPT